MNPTEPLPQSYESERMVLASVIGDSTRYYEVAGIIGAKDFSTPHLAWAWSKLGELCHANSRPTLFNLRENFGSGGHFETVRQSLVGTETCIPSHALDYARTMADRSALRRITIAVDAASAAISAAATASDALQALENAFMDASSQSTSSRGFRSASAIVADLETRLANPKKMPRYPTGFPELNHLLKGGLKERQFCVIGGRTGGGKTVLAMNLAVAVATGGTPVAAFSLEMDDVDLVTRCIFAESHRGQDAAFETIRNLPLYVDDTSNVTLKSIAARMKMMIARHGIKVFIVDYLQLIGTDGQERESRERIVAGMSRLLKVTAKETDCCIIALSQLNESGELRESRAIEQDSDVVLYVIEDEDGDPFLRVVKQRGGKSHGPIKRMKSDDIGIALNWDKQNFRFTEKHRHQDDTIATGF